VSEAWVHCGGRVVRAEEARVSALDAGLLYGDGIYETLRAYGGRPFALPRHLARLARSAARVGLRVPPREALARAIEDTLRANGLEDALVRLTITRGRLARRLDLSSAGEPSVLVATDPVAPGADEERRRGIRVVHSRYRRWSQWPLAGVKTTSYQVSLLARDEARAAGVSEVLLPDETGAVVEGAAANVFGIERGRLVTPPLSCGILGGVTRDVVLEIAREDGRVVSEESFAPGRLEAADEVFLTGTSIQVAPVVRIGERPVGDGRPGPLTLALLDRYLAVVAADTAAHRAGEPAS
jgi:branched-chain amino acid aminotransferase